MLDSKHFMFINNLKLLRETSVTWRLISHQNSYFIISFLYEEFVLYNRREILGTELENDLVTYLKKIRSGFADERDFYTLLDEELNGDEEKVEKEVDGRKIEIAANNYLRRWCDNEVGYLRSFYKDDSIYYDLTSTAHKAIEWVMELEDKTIISAESRLKIIFNLLEELIIESDKNPQTRVKELLEKRKELDRKIEKARQGEISVLEPFQIKEMCSQILEISNRMLYDFRSVETGLISLKDEFKANILEWDGGKGELLDSYFDSANNIKNSDQGKSMEAFWEYLISMKAREYFDKLINEAMNNKIIKSVPKYEELGNIESKLRSGGERILTIISRLDKNLNQFIDDSKEKMELRRIQQLINSIEVKFYRLQDMKDYEIEIDTPILDISLPMTKTLFSIPSKIETNEYILEEAEVDIDDVEIETKPMLDKRELAQKIEEILDGRDEVTLREVVDTYPLKYGLEEIFKYLELDSYFEVIPDYTYLDTIRLGKTHDKVTIMPRVYLKKLS